MAAPTNTFITNNAVGNRESLHDIISILNKDETPFQAAIGSGSAEATYEEWQLDTLGNADTDERPARRRRHHGGGDHADHRVSATARRS